ncbi:MAG: hypothetical protein V7K68_10390 [Nostoc sp.]
MKIIEQNQHRLQAERLFESREDSDRAAIARVMTVLVSWNY